MALWFTDVVTINRPSKSADNYGGQTSGSALVAAGVACDISTTASALFPQAVIGAQEEIRQIYIIALPAGTDCKVGDELTITSWTPNQTVHCQSVLTPESIELELRVVCSLEGEHRA
jgi:hypothetical protein